MDGSVGNGCPDPPLSIPSASFKLARALKAQPFSSQAVRHLRFCQKSACFSVCLSVCVCGCVMLVMILPEEERQIFTKLSNVWTSLTKHVNPFLAVFCDQFLVGISGVSCSLQDLTIFWFVCFMSCINLFLFLDTHTRTQIPLLLRFVELKVFFYNPVGSLHLVLDKVRTHM